MKREEGKKRGGRRARETRQNLAKTKNEREQAGGPRGAGVRQEANGHFNKPQGGKL